ncbi:8201_t:CDS:1 [Paraglomus brasilianum]|uniref:8201_t:CDS:1 n=1 Tax=Paraglomus brasilianum TaxID=144538 RepID=A0A9N8ZWH1_9GLOM|nr:8201_t:CDS:1 [Paraglomus brasilianum]
MNNFNLYLRKERPVEENPKAYRKSDLTKTENPKANSKFSVSFRIVQEETACPKVEIQPFRKKRSVLQDRKSDCLGRNSLSQGKKSEGIFGLCLCKKRLVRDQKSEGIFGLCFQEETTNAENPKAYW